MEKINNVISIPTSIEGKFFRYWFEFTKPIHKLSEREIEVIAAFVKYRYELENKIQDKELLDNIIMNKDTKAKIREECNLTVSHFGIIMAKLKKAKIIENNKINPRFIPKIKNDKGEFNLLISFSFSK